MVQSQEYDKCLLHNEETGSKTKNQKTNTATQDKAAAVRSCGIIAGSSLRIWAHAISVAFKR